LIAVSFAKARTNDTRENSSLVSIDWQAELSRPKSKGIEPRRRWHELLWQKKPTLNQVTRKKEKMCVDSGNKYSE
jgi:hypothetical protein